MMPDPIQRMRKERRWALVIFNLLLLAAAVAQLIAWKSAHSPVQPLPDISVAVEMNQ